MAIDDDAVSEHSQIHSFAGTNSSTDENMNDSLEKAAFGRKHLRRRSSLFFKNAEIDNVITDDISEFGCCNNSSGKMLEEQVITAGRKQRRASVHVRKSIYRPRSKAEIRKFEITCEPPPLTLKPILMSAAQKTARRITMRAKGWNKHKRVHFHSTPNIYDISPRSGKIPGVVKMPDSPPIMKESVISEIASDNIVCDASSDNIVCDASTIQRNILLDQSTSSFQNEGVRFLPAVSKTFQCHLKSEKILEGFPEVKNDESNSGTVGFIASDNHVSQPEQMEVDNSMNAKAADHSEMSSLSEINVAMKKTKRHVEEKVMWVRGDRLRSLSGLMKEDINDKENTNSNKPNDKENNDVQQCNKASIGARHLYPSLLVVPRAGPKAKVRKWLEDIPNQWDHLVDREEDALTFCQQDQIDSGSMVQPDSLLMKKLSSYRTSFGGLPKKQDRKDKCRRRSLCLQKKIIELPTSSRRQTIIVGEVKKNMNEETNSLLGFMSTENANRSPCSASRNTDEIDDDIVLIDDQGLKKSAPEKSSIFYKKKSHTSARQTTTNKSEIAINSSSICNDQLIDEETNYISKHEKKPVLMDEMDFAPFPSISNVGYAEIASANYDLPCGFRQHQISMISYNNNMFQMSLRQKNSDEYESLKEKIVIADSRILLRPRSARKKWSRNGKWESITEELQQNIWSEALRPVGTDELIADSTIVHKLCDWIGMWKERLQKSRSHKTDVRIANRQKRRDSDSFDSFNSDEEGEQLCNTAIIYGHCGSGKTSLIYAVSKRYEMHVLEIASNEKRNGLQLKCKLQGATHSHKFPMLTAVNQMFFRNGKDNEKMIKDSIILVDDCDIIYDKHDDGFWPALRTLCKEAHTPVIIVCEDISLVQKQLGLELPVVIFPLIRPEVQIVSSHLQELCAALNISVCSDICYALAEQYNGDLRACINHLQFYSGEGSDNSLRTLMKQSKSEKQIEIEALPKKYHFISYNVILRNDHSYEPGAVLSSTDREEEVKVVENDMHVAVKVTRSALPAIEYFPLLDVILDYIPYLCIMNKASRAKMPTSRRALHYFDELHGDSQIDSSGALKNVLTQYYLLIH